MLTRSGSDLIGPIRDQHIAQTLLGVRLAGPAPRRRTETLTKITVATGLADDGPRWEDVRPFEQAFVNGLLQTESWPTRFANGRKSSHQNQPRLDGGPQSDISRIIVAQRRWRDRHTRMDMRIDQPRDDHAIAGVDQARTADIERCASRSGRASIRDRHDAIAADENRGAVAQLRGAPVEQTRIANDQINVRDRRAGGLLTQRRLRQRTT